MAQARRFCSRENTDEPMAGTADHVDVWLLLEYRPVWQARVQKDNNLNGPVRTWLEDSLGRLRDAGMRPRLQFVRQPEIDRDDTRLLMAAGERLVEFSGVGYDFLGDVDVVAAARDAAAFPGLQAPRYFVCTNGQRDLCCARFGLPAYQALREIAGERVWQATHLGGHRFAPNVLVLPQGALYGRVDAELVPAFAAVIEAGEIDFRHLRGRCRYPAAVQAAEASAGRGDLKLLGVEEQGEVTRVTFSDGLELNNVAVRRALEPLEVLKSCGDGAETVFPYHPA